MKKTERYLLGFISVLVVAAIVYFFSEIVAYILISWALSMVGEPFMNFFKNKLRFGKFKSGPSLSAFLTLFCFTIIVALLIWIFIPLVVEQARNLSEVDYNSIGLALEEPIRELNSWAGRLGIPVMNEDPGSQIKKLLHGWFDPSKIGNFFGLIVSAAGNILITVFSIFFITFFFLKEQDLFTRIILGATPIKFEKQVENTILSISNLLSRYFVGILIQITFITLFVSLALSLLGIKNALLIGFFAALINVIPYLGPAIGASFAIFITISSNLDIDFYTQMVPMLIKVGVVFIVMQLLDNFFLQPYIFSNSVLAHPLEIFVVILVGAKINGVVGMILAIPIYTAVRVVAREFLSQYKLVQSVTSRMNADP